MTLIQEHDTEFIVGNYTCRPDEDCFVIGYPDTDRFLAVPPEAVRILTWLKEGKGESKVKRLFFQHFGSELDFDDFAATMKQHGFLREARAGAPEKDRAQERESESSSDQTGARVLFRSDRIPQWFAAACFSPYAVLVMIAVVATALVVLFLQPDLIPGYQAFVFEEHVSLYVLALYFFNFPLVLLHEMGHLLAAKRQGVSGSLGMGHRLWIVVSESDISGLWALPREKRYLPYLAGPLEDLFTGSVMVLTLWLWVAPEGFGLMAQRMLNALLMMVVLRLYFQCFFFVRTDFYYVFATLFKCKNLMEDTRDFVKNMLRRLFRAGSQVDQSKIPRGEMRAIRIYSLVWAVGRMLAFGLLFFTLIPVIVKFGGNLYGLLSQGFQRGIYPFFDALLLTLIFLTTLSLGFGMWGRSMWRRIKWKGRVP